MPPRVTASCRSCLRRSRPNRAPSPPSTHAPGAQVPVHRGERPGQGLQEAASPQGQQVPPHRGRVLLPGGGHRAGCVMVVVGGWGWRQGCWRRPRGMRQRPCEADRTPGGCVRSRTAIRGEAQQQRGPARPAWPCAGCLAQRRAPAASTPWSQCPENCPRCHPLLSARSNHYAAQAMAAVATRSMEANLTVSGAAGARGANVPPAPSKRPGWPAACATLPCA
jgi:hypothetical protein